MDGKGRRGSRNIEDRRSAGGGRAAGVGGIGAILLLLAGWYFNIDVSGFIGGGAPAGQSGGGGDFSRCVFLIKQPKRL